MIELEAGWWAMMGQEGRREMCGFEGHGYGSVLQRCCEDNVLFNVGIAPPLHWVVNTSVGPTFLERRCLDATVSPKKLHRLSLSLFLYVEDTS